MLQFIITGPPECIICGDRAEYIAYDFYYCRDHHDMIQEEIRQALLKPVFVDALTFDEGEG